MNLDGSVAAGPRLQAHTAERADPTLWQWLKANPLLGAIASLVILDWVPSLVARQFGYGDLMLSGTKLFIAPLIVALGWSVLRKAAPGANSRSGWLALPIVLVTVGPPVLLDRVGFDRLRALMVSALLIAYFQQVRTLADIRAILRLCAFLSVATAIAQHLGVGGYLEDVQTAVSGDRQVERTFAAGNSSTLGFIPLMAAATLGGVLVWRRGKSPGAAAAMVAFTILLAGAYAIACAAQRSSAAGFMLSLVLSSFYFLMSQSKRSVIVLGSLAIAGALVIGLAGQQLAARASATVYRFTEDSGAGGMAESGAQRMAGLRQFAVDLATQPALLAPGAFSLFSRAGIVPHNVPSEAYYTGGVLLLLAVCLASTKAVANVWRTFRQPRCAADQTLAAALLVLAVVSGFHFMLQAGLQLRPVAMLLGLGLSRCWQPRSVRRVMTLAGGELRQQGTVWPGNVGSGKLSGLHP